MKHKYAIKNIGGSWQVWDLMENEALATFDTYPAAETCIGACEVARRQALAEIGASQAHGAPPGRRRSRSGKFPCRGDSLTV